MRLEKKSHASRGKKTHHVNIRYVCMKDIIELDEINIIYCPTEIMAADYFTKPLQGALFRKYSIIMG